MGNRCHLRHAWGSDEGKLPDRLLLQLTYKTRECTHLEPAQGDDAMASPGLPCTHFKSLGV